mgnify:CR=1 FL=1
MAAFFMIKDDLMSTSIASNTLLRLSAIRGLGLKTFHRLHSEFGSIDKIFLAEFQSLKDLGLKVSICRDIANLKESPILTSSFLNLLNEWSEQSNHHLICLEDDIYPQALKEIYCPPPLLYLKGNISAFSPPSIAIVGSRKPSISGTQHAIQFSQELAREGLCVTSGLALGIDAASHQGALHEKGITCAVLGTGLDIIYPKQHSKLADAICEQGILVSEMSLGSLPMPANFPRRNRIISGLSQGVLVIEASLKSGSLITAQYALEQNREVYAIPGPIDSPVSAGCHALIKQGAQLVESVEDILSDGVVLRGNNNGLYQQEECERRTVTSNNQNDITLASDESTVLTFVDFQMTSFDLLQHHTGFEVAKLTQLLVALELKDEICIVPGGYQRLKKIHSRS